MQGDIRDVHLSSNGIIWPDLYDGHTCCRWRTDAYEAAYVVTLHNHKKEDIVIKVVEPIPGDWQMLSTSLPVVKGDAHTAVFQLPVPADGEAKLVYRVRMRY